MSNQLTPAMLEDPDALRQYPAGEPPAGVIPNFAHPENRGPILVAVGGLMISLMMIFLANRMYTKARIVRKFSWDDLTVSLSALGAITLYVLGCLEIEQGPIGKHQYEIHLSDLFSYNFIIPSYLINIVSSMTLWITKFTFFLLYLQLFQPLRWLRISVYIGASLSTAFYLGVTIAQFVLATPRPHESWTDELISHQNYRVRTLAVPISSIGLVIDVFLLLLPSFAVFNLQMHTRRKIGLMLIFGTGLIAVVASAVSTYYRYENNRTQDSTWSLLPLELMTFVEIDVGVMTACLPAFARMLHHHLPPWRSIKSRLSRYKVTTFFGSGGSSFKRSQKSQSEMETPRKDSRLPAQYRVTAIALHDDSNLGPYLNLESKAEPTIRDDLEMGPMSGVKTFIGGGRQTILEEDGIYLKHDISQGWSSADTHLR